MRKFFKPADDSTAARALDTSRIDPVSGRIPPPRAGRGWHLARKVQRYGHSGQVEVNPGKRAAAA